jgi:hypothetical protein
MLEHHKPYLIAASYCLAASVLIVFCFDQPPPRFMDVFLVAIAFLAARWSWGPAAFTYVCSLLVAAWVLPPRHSLLVADGYDQFRMFSYSLTAVSVMVAIDFAKRNRKP